MWNISHQLRIGWDIFSSSAFHGLRRSMMHRRVSSVSSSSHKEFEAKKQPFKLMIEKESLTGLFRPTIYICISAPATWRNRKDAQMSLSFCLLDVVSMPRAMQTAKYTTSERDALNKAKLSPFARVVQDGDSDDDSDTTPPFEAVSQNLTKIGALTIDRFLRSPPEIDDFDVLYHIHQNRETSPTPPPALPPTEPKVPIKSDGTSKMQCVAQLHHTCQRVFGKTDMLKFEFIEVDGPNSEYCMTFVGFAI
jgi:hypothetical protein